MTNTVQGQKFEDIQEGHPKTVILNYRKDQGTLVYTDHAGHSKKIVKPFNDIFNSINSKVLAANTDIILPTGCVYRTLLQNGNEAFLMQEQPGVRTFRLSQRTATTNLVAKMYNKFQAQTRVLEMNEVDPEKKEEVEKQISLRKQYMSQQKISTNDQGQHYKYFFRVFFPYSYIIITIDRKLQKRASQNKLQFSGMHAAIALEPINTLNDYVYQFPLSNVSKGGSVCTGQLPLGNYGHINVKTYVEKMTGYFWNNKFNADITAGPELYGDKNFLGNWFEWEFTSYVNPSAVLTLNFNEKGIKEQRLSVGRYVYNSNNSNRGQTQIHTINETTFVEGFQSNDAFGDTSVDIENGIAKKTMEGIAQSMTLEGYDISLGTIVETDKKKFKIISYDGYRTYKVDDSTMYEKDIMLTHYKLKEQNGGIHTMTLNENGKKFLANAYRKAKNFVLKATFGDMTFKSGELVAFDTTGEFVSEVGITYDMIKSIREQELGYIIELYDNGESLRVRRDAVPKEMRKIEIVFAGATDDIIINQDEEFAFRTCKIIKDNEVPLPYMIRDHLSSVCKATVCIDNILYKEEKHRNYHYGQKSHVKGFHIDYTLKKEGLDDEEETARVADCILKISDEKLQLAVSLPEYIQLSSQDFEEITPQVKGSTLTIIGDRAFQTIASSGVEDMPFKVMRDNQGDVRISTVDTRRRATENMFFKPSNDHLKTCIKDIDGTLQFKVRDMFEVGTEREYIEFNVGDEILLSSDWDPRRHVPPSVKKIYDFVTIEDRSERNALYVSAGRNSDYITSGTPNEVGNMIINRYKKYAKQVESLDKATKTRPLHEGFSAPKGILYAVIKDDNNRLIFHPMIDSEGRHFLNGISHAKKEIGDIKAGDFIKADVGKIPYFAKKVVDEVVCFVDINGRDLCILKSGYTMWRDIVEKGFKVFRRDKLTAAKIEFYEGKVRQPNMNEFMVVYGDQYFGQIGTPILTRHDDHSDDLDPEDYKKELFGTAYEIGQHTNGIDKITYDRLRTENGDHCFETFTETCILTKMTVRMDNHCSAFRSLFEANLTLGNNQHSVGNSYDHIGYVGQSQRFYDICYSLDNRSLTNGSAYMPMDDCFYRPMISYSYYSSPYKVGKPWLSTNHVKVAMLTIPTPRMLKKSTRDKKSFKVYKLMGPQNRFYNFLSGDQLANGRNINNDHIMYNITSDNFLPAMEE